MSTVLISTPVVAGGLAAVAALAGAAGTVKLGEAIILGEAESFYQTFYPDEWDLIQNSPGSDEKTKALNEWNAFAHTYTSYRLADLSGSEDFSHFMGDAREEWTELFGDNKPNERNKDEWNNSFGRELYGDGLTKEQVADRLKQEIENYRADPASTALIVDPDPDNDLRQYSGPYAIPDDNLLDDLQDLADDYGWAWDNPEAILGELPDWLQGVLDFFDLGKTKASPLVVDLDGYGIELTAFDAATTTTFFDIDNDGFAEQTAWITADQMAFWRETSMVTELSTTQQSCLDLQP